MSDYYVASFHSISQALRFEKLLQSQAVEVKMIPVPRIISSSCGIAARFSPEDKQTVITLIETEKCDLNEIYLFTYEGKKAHAERVYKND